MRDLFTINTPNKLNAYLNKCKYGIVDLNGTPLDVYSKDFSEKYRTLTSDEFNTFQVGVCWDFANFESVWFKKHGYRFKTYYVIFDDKKTYPTHTFLVYEEDGKYKYFESSWKKHQGIHVASTMDAIFQSVIDWNYETIKKCPYYLFEYEALDKLSHMTCNEYMNHVEQKEIKYEYRKVDKSMKNELTKMVLEALEEDSIELNDASNMLTFIETADINDVHDIQTMRECMDLITESKLGTRIGANLANKVMNDEEKNNLNMLSAKREMFGDKADYTDEELSAGKKSIVLVNAPDAAAFATVIAAATALILKIRKSALKTDKMKSIEKEVSKLKDDIKELSSKTKEKSIKGTVAAAKLKVYQTKLEMLENKYDKLTQKAYAKESADDDLDIMKSYFEDEQPECPYEKLKEAEKLVDGASEQLTDDSNTKDLDIIKKKIEEIQKTKDADSDEDCKDGECDKSKEDSVEERFNELCSVLSGELTLEMTNR